ncbi:hypothetical protein SDC9_183081 [bioreactor metagenome]|uniref:Uncharacterized protein n=1 Tax=bioreactor metagenome TaxID=1076179 RepID=A0A645HIU6_9ZZZZ
MKGLLRDRRYPLGGEAFGAQYRIGQRHRARVAAFCAHRAHAEDHAHKPVVLFYARRPAAEVLRVADAGHRRVVITPSPAARHADDDYSHIVVAEVVARPVVGGRGEEGARVDAPHLVFDGGGTRLEVPAVVAEEVRQVFAGEGMFYVVLQPA